MRNSDNYLTEAIRNKLTPEELEIINVMQHGSSTVLKQKVNDAAMQMIMSRHSNSNALKKIPWYKKWWGILISIAAGLTTIGGLIKLIYDFFSSLQ